MTSLLGFFAYSRNDGVALAFVGAFAGVYLFYRGFRLLQRKRLILNTPASKIRSAAMGLVEINGLAVGPYTMLAPITGVPCYYFHTTAWQWQQRGQEQRMGKSRRREPPRSLFSGRQHRTRSGQSPGR